MQQYFTNNFENDPSRIMWKGEGTSTHIVPVQKHSSRNRNIFQRIIEENDLNKNQLRDKIYKPVTNTPSLSGEIIEKDKEIQGLQFKIKQKEHIINELKGKLELIPKIQEENKTLNDKLQKEYEKNQDVVNLRNQNSFLEKQFIDLKRDNHLLKGNIQKMKKKVKARRKKKNKNKTMLKDSSNDQGSLNDSDNLFNNGSEGLLNKYDDQDHKGGSTDTGDTRDEEVSQADTTDEGLTDQEDTTDEEDTSDEEIITEDYNYNLILESLMEEKKEKYKNEKLKNMIYKYYKGVGGKKIDDLFILMEITEETEITKDLVTKIILSLKE